MFDLSFFFFFSISLEIDNRWTDADIFVDLSKVSSSVDLLFLLVLLFVSIGKFNKSTIRIRSSSMITLNYVRDAIESIDPIHMCCVSFRVYRWEKRKKNDSSSGKFSFSSVRSFHIDSIESKTFHFSVSRSRRPLCDRHSFSFSSSSFFRSSSNIETNEDEERGKFLTFVDFGIHLLNLPDQQQWPFYFLSFSSSLFLLLFFLFFFLFFSLLFDPKGNKWRENDKN